MMEALGWMRILIEHKMLTKCHRASPEKVESRNFQICKSVLEYDDVMNTQREIIYSQRRQVLDGEDVSVYIKSMISDVIRMNGEPGRTRLYIRLAASQKGIAAL